MTKPITLNLTLKELQQIDKYVEINDDTLSVIMKITNAYPQQKSSAEEAYKEVYGWYPPTTPSVSNYGDERWSAFQKGYNSSKKDYKVGEYQPTSQEPEELKTLFDVIRNLGYSVDMCYEIVDAVEEFEKSKEPEKEPEKWNVVRESVKWCEEHREESVEDYLSGPYK